MEDPGYYPDDWLVPPAAMPTPAPMVRPPAAPGMPAVAPPGGVIASLGQTISSGQGVGATASRGRSMPSWWTRAGNAVGEAMRHVQPNNQPVRQSPMLGMNGMRGPSANRNWQAPHGPALARPGNFGVHPRFGVGFEEGGMVPPEMPMVPGEAGSPSGLIQGPGGGKDDNVQILVSPGEYVISADEVAMIGDGSNERGAQILDGWRARLREAKTGSTEHQPKTANVLQQMMGDG